MMTLGTKSLGIDLILDPDGYLMSIQLFVDVVVEFLFIIDISSTSMLLILMR